MRDPNDLTENQVVTALSSWLVAHGFCLTEPPKYNRQKGDDISVVASDGQPLFVECKGSIGKSGAELPDWAYSAMAVFGAVKETEELRPSYLHGIAVPDTAKYRKTLGALDAFLARQNIILFWVQASGSITLAGAPNESMQRTLTRYADSRR